MALVYYVDHITKIYERTKKKANDDLSLTIYEGEVFGLLGPNGSGKSTLVKQLTGLMRPTRGRINLFGIDVVRLPEIITDYVALQPQWPAALMNLYPEEALIGSARLRGATPALARWQAQKIIDELELGPLCKKALRTLSGGQLQIVNVALALVGDRPVQIFDEPTNNLAPEIRKRVWSTLLERHRQGVTIILVTHDVAEAEHVLQRVGIINHGRVLALGTIGELKSVIDQRIRLELLLKSEALDYAHVLENIGEAQAFTSQHWHILCQRENVQAIFEKVVTTIGLEHLDDFRVLTPSLEDVYLQLLQSSPNTTNINN